MTDFPGSRTCCHKYVKYLSGPPAMFFNGEVICMEQSMILVNQGRRVISCEGCERSSVSTVVSRRRMRSGPHRILSCPHSLLSVSHHLTPSQVGISDTSADDRFSITSRGDRQAVCERLRSPAIPLRFCPPCCRRCRRVENEAQRSPDRKRRNSGGQGKAFFVSCRRGRRGASVLEVCERSPLEGVGAYGCTRALRHEFSRVSGKSRGLA